MTALGERTLMLSLCDTEAMEEMSRQGFMVQIVPTIDFRDVVTYAITYHQQYYVAPSPDILRERFGADVFTQHGIDLDDDVEETIGWAITDLKASWIQNEVGAFTRKLAMEIGSTPPEAQVDKLGELSAELSGKVLSLQPRTTQMDIRESGPGLLAEYDMAAEAEGIRGMRMGIPEIDQHLGGIWPGELVVMGGPAGTGKSFFANLVAYNEWQRGVNTTIYTLENSILMTQMRIACCALHLDIQRLQNGSLEPQEELSLREWCNDVLLASDTPLNIIAPDLPNRSPQTIIQQARAYDTESLIIDQLTHLAPVDPGARQQRNEQVADIVRTLGDTINSGSQKLPCLLMHQINREGIKEAARSGRLNMTHMAESAEIERTASVAMSLYQSEEYRQLGWMQIQMLKQRRVPQRHWSLAWAPWEGLVSVNDNQVSFDDVHIEGQLV